MVATDVGVDAIREEFASYLATPWAVEDPPELFRRVRAAEPVMKGYGNNWYITGYRAADEAYSHPAFSRQLSARQTWGAQGVAGRDPPELVHAVDCIMTWILNTDDPDHARRRKLVAPSFSPKAIQPLRAVVERMTEDLLDSLEGRDRFDFLHEFAYAIPEYMICAILGVPNEDMKQLVRWTNESSGFNSIVGAAPEEALRVSQRAWIAQCEYFHKLIAQKRARPGDALIDELLTAEEDGDRLNEDELVGMLMLLVAAGHHTTANLIANMMLALLQHPDQMALLRADPTLARQGVEETLRYDPSSAGNPRVALEDVVIGGKRIKAGDQVIIVLRAANRDPDFFDDPDRFLITRQNNRHMSFGRGIHNCLGMALGRMEATIAWEGVARRLGGVELDTPKVERHRTQHRSLASLPVRRVAR